MTAARWASMAEPVRRPLGTVSSRILKGVKTDGLPKRPVGDYAIIQFQTRFALPADTIETVMLVRERTGWFVAGYTIVPDVKP